MTPRSSSSRPCPSTYSHIASRSLSSTWSILSEGQKGLAFIIMVDTLLHHYQRLWKVEATAEISITRQRPKRPKSRVRPASTAAFSSLNNLCHSPYLPKNIVPKKVVNCPNLEKSVFFLKCPDFFFKGLDKEVIHTAIAVVKATGRPTSYFILIWWGNTQCVNQTAKHNSHDI